jgi:hypothetical protein
MQVFAKKPAFLPLLWFFEMLVGTDLGRKTLLSVRANNGRDKFESCW